MEKRTGWKTWEKPGDPHLMNRIRWDKKELDSIERVFNEDWFGYGKYNQELEKRLGEYTGIPYFNLTNSGSTAIMTALKVLMHEGKLKRGDLILHPITTFPTSISSAIDLGMIPVFIDTKQHTYVVDEEQVEKAVKKYPEIKGMILPHLLGNIPNMERIVSTLDGRYLIEDCCDTLGGRFKEKQAGSFGIFMALSFYGSHHITSGGVGGAIGTKDHELSKIAKSVISWGHDWRVRQVFTARYDCQTIGSDFQMTEIQAAFALSQMGRLETFVEERKRQFEEMDSFFKEYDFFYTPVSDPDSKPSWFSYPLLLKDSAPFTRDDFVEYLIENNVEIRPIMCGNLLRQEPYKRIERVSLNNDNFPIGDKIQKDGLFIPCWGMPDNQKEDYYKILSKYMSSHSSTTQ